MNSFPTINPALRRLKLGENYNRKYKDERFGGGILKEGVKTFQSLNSLYKKLPDPLENRINQAASGTAEFVSGVAENLKEVSKDPLNIYENTGTQKGDFVITGNKYTDDRINEAIRGGEVTLGALLRFSDFITEKGGDIMAELARPGGAKIYNIKGEHIGNLPDINVDEDFARLVGQLGTGLLADFGVGKFTKATKLGSKLENILAIANPPSEYKAVTTAGTTMDIGTDTFKSLNTLPAVTTAAGVSGIEDVNSKFITTRNLNLNQKQLIAAQKLIVDNYTKEIARLKAAGKSKNRIALIERKLRDARISPPKAIIEEFLGGVSERGYQRVGTKNVYGGTKDLNLIQETVKKGDDLIQHHLLLNAEGGSLGKKYAMMNDLYRVNMWQWLAKGGITPGHLKNNMALIARNPHIKELHPMLKSLGFDDYIRKLPNDLSGQQLFEAMEVWRENVYLPSLALTEDLIASGHKTLITVNPDNTGLILPKHVMNAIKKKNTTLADNLADYLTDLRYERPLSPLPKSDGRRHIGGR